MEKEWLSRRNILIGSGAVASASLLSLNARGAKEVLPEVDLPGRTPNTPFAVNVEMWFQGPFSRACFTSSRARVSRNRVLATCEPRYRRCCKDSAEEQYDCCAIYGMGIWYRVE